MTKLATKQELLNKLAEEAPTLAEGLAVGVALALKNQGLTTKQDLRPFKVLGVVNELRVLVQLVRNQREAFKQELKRVWHYGPSSYLSKKSAKLR